MQKLHLVGFTPELDGLILSARKGAKSGSFVVKVDPALVKQLGVTKDIDESSARTNGTRTHGPRASLPDSQLGPREMQELLRGGWSLEEVAVEAGVDVDWVSRFAAPVLAEMHLVLEQARECVFSKPRVGPSALSLFASVRRNVAERGIRFTDEDFEDRWRAYQLDDELWIVAFEYLSRGKKQSAEWLVDLETAEVTSRGRLGTQLGHVQSAKRRVDTTAPKPKPKAAATRAVRTPIEPPPPPPGNRTMVPPKPAPAPQRPRPRQPAPRPATAKKAGASSTKAPKPPAAPPAVAVGRPAGGDGLPAAQTAQRDPWREELRRRELERSAAIVRAAEADAIAAAAVPAPPPPPPPPTPAPIEEAPLRVSVIGPTVRTLTRRPPPRREPEPPPPPRPRPRRPAPPRDDETGPTPVVSGDLPDLTWSPGGKGPLPAPEPLPVPEEIRERVSTPLGPDDEVELGADTWFPPSRPVFKGAHAATPSGAAGEAPVRRRRSEPLRGR